MVEHNDTLYVATDTEILTSTDSGSTWNSLGSHPKGAPAGLVITDAGFYLGLTEGVYHSQDRGSSWVSLKDGLDAKRIHALAAVENTVFAGTDNGLYRLKCWDMGKSVHSSRRGEHGETDYLCLDSCRAPALCCSWRCRDAIQIRNGQ